MTERILLNIHDQSVFTDILDIAGEAIISVDAKYRILLFNKKAQQIFGYAADEIMGQSLDLLLPQRFHAAHHEHITKFAQSDIPSRLMGERQEIFGLRRNGQEFPAEASISKLGIDGQHVFIVIIGDITRRKQMEQELQKHHKQLESLVEDRTIKLTTSLAETKLVIERLQQEIIEREQIEEQLQASYEYLDTILLNLPAGVAILEGPDFRYFRINRTLAKLNGLPVEEHLGKTLIEVLPDAEQRILPEMRQIMDTGKPILDREFTMSLPSDPDTPVNLVDYLFPILGTDRKIRAIGAVVINITERKQAEQALRKSEEKYRDLVEKVSDVIYTVDAGGVITYLNPAIESLIGLPPEQVVGKSFAQFILPEDFDQAEDNFKELLSGVAPGSNEYRVLTATGETRWIRATSQPIMNEGQVTGVQGVLTNITERKMMDEKIEETATAVERQRLARELHDSVTQILYSIDLFSNATQQALSSGRIDTAKEHSSQVRSLSQSALADMRLLIFELQPPMLEKEGLVSALRNRLELVESRAGFETKFEVIAERPLPSSVESDLYAIAMEALNNTLKHAQAEHITINLEYNGQNTCLTISDDGNGFDPQLAEKSHGFGLRNMRERVERMDGSMTLETSPGRGTTVSVELTA